MLSGVNQILTQFVNLLQWWIVIAPWEMAIRVRHGKQITVLPPGIHLRIPGLDRFFVQSTRRRYMNTPTQTITTLDGKAVTVSGGTSYTIEDIALLYKTLSDPEDVIQIETMGLVAQCIAGQLLSGLSTVKIQAYVDEHLHLERYGLGNVEFVITDYMAVKTYRLIQSNPKDWGGGGLSTMAERAITAKAPY